MVCRALCLWKGESLLKAWACPSPSDVLTFGHPSSVRKLLGQDQIVSQVVNDANLSCKDKIRRLKALKVN